jgi:hypothetical protein
MATPLPAKLPRCPDPKCVGCSAPLRDVRPFRADKPHARLFLVHVLSRCARCQTPHIGVRVLMPAFGGLRYIRQNLERYTPERKAELELIAEFLSRGEHPAELHADLPYPEQPQFAVWFENTLTDPERAAPATPAIGLPNEALQPPDGIEVLERRQASATHLSGVLVRGASVEAAQDFLSELKASARAAGTIAWVRRYDVTDYRVAWDTFTPAPGSEYIGISAPVPALASVATPGLEVRP